MVFRKETTCSTKSLWQTQMVFIVTRKIDLFLTLNHDHDPYGSYDSFSSFQCLK